MKNLVPLIAVDLLYALGLLYVLDLLYVALIVLAPTLGPVLARVHPVVEPVLILESAPSAALALAHHPAQATQTLLVSAENAEKSTKRKNAANRAARPA
ncbi:hypothetical protein CTheo_3865 [Ceratobasidium theobromae]|uniref:Transmembrane protein n=1 Tax=Ceratobasidium theobromae TaxID=1582974 RepID=A0A5N5QLK3_9AGAM|nr:hypothetical protein CTheo_3865 [Ceratobasidium theobromae]